MNIEITNLTNSKIDKNYFQKIGKNVLRKLKQPKGVEVSLVFVNDAEMRKLNKKYRGMDKMTDVLSFLYGYKKNPPHPSFVKGGSNLPLFCKGRIGGIFGEIVISIPQAKKQAAKRSYPLKRELSELFVHGILHLSGYEDERAEDYNKMMAQQKKIVKYLGY